MSALGCPLFAGMLIGTIALLAGVGRTVTRGGADRAH